MEKLTLYTLTERQQQIEDLLVENGGELTPEIEQMLNETTDALAVKVDGYNHIIRRLEGFAASAKAEADRLTKLRRTSENAVRSLKSHIAEVMKAQGIEKLESDTCKISWRKTTAVEVTDEDALVRPYRQVIDTMTANLPGWLKVDVSISKTALGEAIKSGSPVAGAEIVENRNIQIR